MADQLWLRTRIREEDMCIKSVNDTIKRSDCVKFVQVDLLLQDLHVRICTLSLFGRRW